MTISFRSSAASSTVSSTSNQPYDDNQPIVERGTPAVHDSADHRLSGLSRRCPLGSGDDIEAPTSPPPLQRSLSGEKADHPYPDWNLQAVALNHRDRLHQFFIHKGGFSGPESAEQFWREHLLTLTKEPTPAKSTIRTLRSKYFEKFPEEAKTYQQKSAGPNTAVAQVMHEILRNPNSRPLSFPKGKKYPTILSILVVVKAKKQVPWLNFGN